METLRCPTCLSLLSDTGRKRCPACRSRLGPRTRPIVLGENAGIAARPLLLVERELEARVEAKTASRYRQRRRAAKVARRIAALPPTVLNGVADAHAGTTPHEVAFIDVPAEAIHEARSTAAVVEVTPEVVEPEVVEPEVVEVVVIEPEVVEPEVVEPEVVEVAVVEPEVVEAIAETAPIEVVEPVAESVAEIEPEPEVERAPAPPVSTGPPGRNTAWTERVFSADPWRRRTQTVVWPPQRRPETPSRESVAADEIV